MKKKWKYPKIRHNKLTQWNWMVAYPQGLALSPGVDIGAFTYINARFGVNIDENVQIGGGCHIYSHNSINNTFGYICIEKNVKIGAHCVILPNVRIKEGVLIKAGSILTAGVYFLKNGKLEVLRK